MAKNKTEAFLEAFGRSLVDVLNTVRRKNADYATVEEPFDNFETSAMLAGVTPEQGILVRMADKFVRIRNLINRSGGPSVLDERLEDSLRDLIGYANILIQYERQDEIFESVLFDVEPEEEPPPLPPDPNQVGGKDLNWFVRLFADRQKGGAS